MKNPELNLSNDEIGLLNVAIISAKATWLGRFATATTEDEAKMCVATLDKLDTLHGKFRAFAEAVNEPKSDEKVDDSANVGTENPVVDDAPKGEDKA